MRHIILALCLTSACTGGNTDRNCDNFEDPIYEFEQGQYTAELDGTVPAAIRDAFGDPAPGPVTLQLNDQTATLTYETVDGEAVEVVLDLGALGTADVPF